MSWDVLLFEVPPDCASIADIPKDFQPRKFARSELIAKIQSAFPQADFSSPSWGLVGDQDWSIEVNIGQDEQTSGPMLHVRGGSGAAQAVLKICDVLGLRGLDCSTSEFLRTETDASASFGRWAAYRDQILNEYRRPGLLQRLLGIFR